MTDDENGTAHTSNEPSDEFLAALGNLDILESEAAFARLNTARNQYLVDSLPLLPDDGLGVGEATLHRIPAHAQGEQPHSTTWAVRIDYEHDGPKDYHVGTYSTENEARTEYAALVQGRLNAGHPDPTKPDASESPA